MILPLTDHRGFARACVAGWAGQTLPADRFEIVAVTPGNDPRLDRQVRRFLRPRDRFLVVRRAAEIELYRAGAEAATGDVLLFTELHCVPEPDAAEAVSRFFSASDTTAGSLRAIHIPRGRIARLEALMGQHEEARRTAAGRWADVSLRGFALRAHIFRRLGGFRPELERFAETALALELERGGWRIQDIPDAVVNHADCDRVSELEPALLALGRGRRAFLEEAPSELAERFLGQPDWIEHAALEGRAARALCRVIARSLLSSNGDGSGTALARSLAGLAPAALGGARGALLAARARARLSLLRCLRPGGDAERHLPRFAVAWRTLVRCGEMERLTRRALPPPSPPDDPPLFAPGEMDDVHFLGFHAREADARGSFRWSRPAGLVRLHLKRGDYEVRLTASSPPGERAVRLFFNGRRVPFTAEPGEPWQATFRLERRHFHRGGEQHLGVVCAPFVPSTAGSSDPRVLGLALRALHFDRPPSA